MNSQSTNTKSTPNHDNETYIIYVIFMVFSIIAVILRSVVVHLKKSSYSINDFLVIVALVYKFGENFYKSIWKEPWLIVQQIFVIAESIYSYTDIVQLFLF